MNKMIFFAIILGIVYIGVFLIPGNVDNLALIPEKSYQAWRFITYSFTHLN